MSAWQLCQQGSYEIIKGQIWFFLPVTYLLPFGAFTVFLAIFKSFADKSICLPFLISKILLALPKSKSDIKMLLSNFFLNCFNTSESSGINLPTEVLIHIWSFLDFNTCQTICTRVSKEWLYKIRNSTRLSGEMKMTLEMQNVKDINDALSRWPKLKVLHLSDCDCNYRSCNCNDSRLCKLVSYWQKSKKFFLTTDMLGINLTEHALLRKVVVQKSMPLFELGDWGKATKVWFDPKNWIPANLANVKNLILYVDLLPKYSEIVQIGKLLMNVEELYITEKNSMVGVKLDSEFILGLKSFILRFKNLTEVLIVLGVNITDFLDLLQSIASVKGVKFSLYVCIGHNHMEENYVEGVFEEGFKIVENTFPIESTDVSICDSQYDFKIDKRYNNKPVLYETSDDEELTENDENSSVEEFEDYYENSNFVV